MTGLMDVWDRARPWAQPTTPSSLARNHGNPETSNTFWPARKVRRGGASNNARGGGAPIVLVLGFFATETQRSQRTKSAQKSIQVNSVILSKNPDFFVCFFRG